MITGKVYWDQDRNLMMNDPPDDDPTNDTLSITLPVYLEVTGVEQLENLVREFRLFQNHPNPFNPKTVINYELPITNDVELSIYNVLGQKVITLVSEKQKAGHHQVEWDASGFPSGVYYYVLKAGEFRDVKKMVYLK